MGQIFARPCIEKVHHKKGLAEWLKVQALSSNLSTTPQKNLIAIGNPLCHLTKVPFIQYKFIHTYSEAGVLPVGHPLWVYGFPNVMSNDARCDCAWTAPSFFFFFFAVLGLELLHLALSHSMSLFMQRVFSKQGFMELFAQAGFKP
jgi:hypothetical protein